MGVKWKIHNLNKDKVMKMKNMSRSLNNEALAKSAEGDCSCAEAQREIDRRERRRARRAAKSADKAAWMSEPVGLVLAKDFFAD